MEGVERVTRCYAHVRETKGQIKAHYVHHNPSKNDKSCADNPPAARVAVDEAELVVAEVDDDGVVDVDPKPAKPINEADWCVGLGLDRGLDRGTGGSVPFLLGVPLVPGNVESKDPN